MTRLVVTADAEVDTREILSYLEREAGPTIAAKYGRRFRSTLQRLIDLPETGAPRPSLGAHARIGIVSPYILIYDFVREDDLLVLLRILHGRRNITRDLLRRRTR
jgi:toxin ParE1/3/4